MDNVKCESSTENDSKVTCTHQDDELLNDKPVTVKDDTETVTERNLSNGDDDKSTNDACCKAVTIKLPKQEVKQAVDNGSHCNTSNKGRRVGRRKKENVVSDADDSKSKNPVRSKSAPAPRKKEKPNHLVTDYFPVRRSSRMCKSDVKKQKQTELENAILMKNEDGLEVVDFGEKGRGVVATKSFNRGDFVVEYAGELIYMNMANERETMYLESGEGCYMYYFNYKNNRYCVDATKESGRLGRLLNHSKTKANCMTRVVGIGSRPYLILVAARHIKPNEELLYDYGDRSKSSLESHPWLSK